jgi:hypothetical protein
MQMEWKTTHLLCLSRDLLQQKIQSWSLLLNHKKISGHVSFNVFKPYPVVSPTQGPGHWFCPSHQVNPNVFYKSKRCCLGKKQ